MMKRAFMLLLLLSVLPVAAQHLTGVWSGDLNVMGQALPIIFRVTCGQDSCRTTLDSPMQGVQGVPVVLSSHESEVEIGIPQFNAAFKGTLTDSTTITGVFTQNGYDFPLILKRMQMHRPQEPQKPWPYECREVEIPNAEAGITLKGTLTMPRGEGPFPAVVLVTGSGLQNRDEEVLGHKPFLVLADYLTRAGIAVLRCDDRGFGESDEVKQRLAGATTADFAGDVLAAFGLLRTLPEVDPARIGILGHSEGGDVALIAAARCPDVAFVASLAGGLVKGSRVHAEQLRQAALAQGLPVQMVDDFFRLLKPMYAIMEQTPSEKIDTEGLERLNVLLEAEGRSLPEPFHQNLRSLLALGKDPWFRFFLTYDPAADIQALGQRPLLAVNGDKDVQVDAAMNLEAVTALRPATEHPSDLIRTYKGMNHLFQPCIKGTVDEYEQIEITIAPEVLEDVAQWMNGLFR